MIEDKTGKRLQNYIILSTFSKLQLIHIRKMTTYVDCENILQPALIFIVRQQPLVTTAIFIAAKKKSGPVFTKNLKAESCP